MDSWSGIEGTVGSSFLVGATDADVPESCGFDCWLDETSGFIIRDEMMAGSTGAPGTVEWAVGALRAGGVYRFGLVLANGL